MILLNGEPLQQFIHRTNIPAAEAARRGGELSTSGPPMPRAWLPPRIRTGCGLCYGTGTFHAHYKGKQAAMPCPRCRRA